ncbi:MAG: hydroxyacid dehydrogenase, partial [Planctomycetes bacterium]|nr:hydroxyacid dehydrogenase [Planctomycetota bacterium]
MNVLIADKFSRDGIDELESAGCKVTLDPGLAGDALRAAVAESNCTVLIVRGTRVSADAVSASAQLSLIVRAGAGYNTIDVAAASNRAVLVANCPGKNAVAVAELTFALILALDRRIVENVTDLRNGVWNKKEYTTARG